MRMNWLLCAAATVCVAAPAMAQRDAVLISTTAGMPNYTNVDVSEVRDTMDRLRGYLERIQDNNRRAFSASDAVHVDAYRRMNMILLDNASSLAWHAADTLGGPTHIPPGLGATRDYMALLSGHLATARMMADYGVPITEAHKALTMAYEHMDRSNRTMSG